MGQRTKEWFAERENRITGSLVGAILGLSPFMTRTQAMRAKLGLSEFKGNAATSYGTAMEPLAMADFEEDSGRKVKSASLVIHPEHDWLAASPDGILSDGGLVEMKCPYGLRDDPEPSFKSINDQPHYYAQMQIQMYCTGAIYCIFYQWNRFNSRIEHVDYNQNWIDENLPILKAFYDEMIMLKASDFGVLEHEYSEALEQLELAKERVENIKHDIIEKSKELNTETLGRITCKKVERKGSIDYSKIESLKEIDLEQYRKKSSAFYKVSI